MALLDFLKNKKDVEKAKKTEKPVKKISAVKKTETKKDEVKKVPATPVVTSKKSTKFSYDAVRRPHISEKATIMAEKNQYVFEVLPNTSKQEIKKSVEGIYGVNVLSVNKVRIPAKKRRLGRTQGWRKAYQKAIVKIKEGQKIEIL